MFRLAIAAGVAWALALSAASAADKPEVAAPEAWVRPPPKTPAPPAASAGAATADLIEDQQQHFDGREEALYYAYQVKALNAEGLQALGTVSMQWSPATDRLVIHHIRILRGDQVIDALPKDGGFNVARREDKLDSEGILDGDLSIILPLEGLQVGDVVDVAFTVHHLDPILKGRVDRTTAIGGGAPAAFARIRLSWPQSDAVHWRASTGMPEPHVTNVDGYTEAEVQLENPAPIVKPKGAPARFQHDRELSVSSYQSWQEVSQSMAPLYAAAATLSATSPVKAEAAAIAARTSDPEERASAALALVEDRIRYLAQTLGEGGLKPNAADDTWTHRYGDCKAKTALLLALLTELGIRAEPILVSTTLGEDLDTRLPSLSFFDHVMVHTVIGGRDRWLDGTRSGDEALAALETPSYGFVLPVRAEGAGLLKIAREPAAAPQILTVLKLDASKGVLAPASAHAELTLRGDLATAARVSIGALSAADRDKALRTYWKGVFDSMIVSSTSAAFDAKTGEAHLVADGEAKLDWSGGGFEPPGAVVGLKLDIERDADAVNPDAPFAIRFPFYVAQEVTLIMPGQGKGYAEHGDTLDRQLGGYELKREATIKDGVFRMRASMRALAPEIPFAEAKAAAEPLAQLARTTLRLRPPANAAPPSSDDLQTLLAATPSDAAGYAKRGNALYAAARYREAIRDYDQALALDPKLAWVMGNRALSHYWLGEYKLALADADLAEDLDPREPTTYRTRGLVAEREGDWAQVVANFTRSIDLAPSAFAYTHRGRGYVVIKDYARALRDFDAELKAEPESAQPHLNKANVLIKLKQPDQARAELDAVKAQAATDDGVRAARWAYLVQLGDRATALSEADAAVQATPTARAYLQRMSVRDPSDVAAAEGDARAAYDREPQNLAAIRALVFYRFKAKDYAGALEWSDRAVAAKPQEPALLIERAEIRSRLDRKSEARTDFSTARALIRSDAGLLNTLCWQQAIEGLDLDQALADCDASLQILGAANTLDSRAFVLMRLGRLPDARAAYDEALAKRPDSAESLYGRSLVERRLGDAPAADRDQAAALAIDEKVVETYAGYGVKA